MLFGTGAGIAFFFLRAQRSGDSRINAAVSQDEVLADMVFTATAVVMQPVRHLLSPMVYARVAGLHRRADNFLFDGGETGTVRRVDAALSCVSFA